MTEEPRQHVERAATGRRARLTPAPGTDVAPEAPPATSAPAAPTDDAEATGTRRKRPRGSSDDERITRERPPHW